MAPVLRMMDARWFSTVRWLIPKSAATAYRTYFKNPELPARAFIGAGSLLGGAHFEVMGIAVKNIGH